LLNLKNDGLVFKKKETIDLLIGIRSQFLIEYRGFYSNNGKREEIRRKGTKA